MEKLDKSPRKETVCSLSFGFVCPDPDKFARVSGVTAVEAQTIPHQTLKVINKKSSRHDTKTAVNLSSTR